MSIRYYFQPEHREAPGHAATSDEVDHLVNGLLAQPFDLSMANLYLSERAEDDGIIELSIGLDPERGVGSLQYSGPEGRWFSKGETSDYEEVVYCYFGSGCEYPRNSELSIEAIRKAAKQFLAAPGLRPDSVDWQPEPPLNIS